MEKIDFYNSEHYPDPTAFFGQLHMAKEEAAKAYRPTVYICSPYAGNITENKKFARRCCRFAVGNHFIPLAVHLLYPQFMDDETPEERELALFFGKVWVSHCDELWVCGDVISPGMEAEIEKAKRKNKKIRYIKEVDGRLKEVAANG